MSSINQIAIIRNGKTFSPFYFYNSFLQSVAGFYNENHKSDEMLSFSLTDEEDGFTGRYRIDPISIPLLLSFSYLMQQYHGGPVPLKIINMPATNGLLKFLYMSNFFHIAGNNENPVFPIGRNLLSFDKDFLGGFDGRSIRQEHKVRCYSLNDENVEEIYRTNRNNEDRARDLLIEHYSYSVVQHFQTLLQEFASDNVLFRFYIDVLSELITNGVLHSGSDVFALMFSDHYSTKFSISDNGIGLGESLNKEGKQYTNKYEFSRIIRTKYNWPNNNESLNALLSIFEAFYYSIIKSRTGLFDLLISVVYDYHGYFRIHNDCSQVIISPRLIEIIKQLKDVRDKIRYFYVKKNMEKYNNNSNNKLTNDNEYTQLVQGSMNLLVSLFGQVWEGYTQDTRYSAVRFFPVVFKGVHIEVEISK